MKELFADVCSAVYKVSEEYRSRPKCDKCGSYRRIRYKNPVTGKNCEEICPYCGSDYMVYAPQELQAYEAKMNNFYCEANSLTVWYRKPDDKDGYLYVVQEFSDDKPFQDIRRYNAFFKSRERCQAYCDWLNEYERRAGAYIPYQGLMIDRPCEVKCLFYTRINYAESKQRVDLANLQEAIDDVLVAYHLLADDNCRVIVSHDGSRVLHDKARPRTEVTIRFLNERSGKT